MRRKILPDKLLTHVELEIMGLLWRLQEATVHQVQKASDRELAYTSISTVLRILEQKGFVLSRKEGRGHVYLPAVSKQDYEGKALGHVVENVFEGAPASLVRCLIETQALSTDDLKAIAGLLQDAK